MSKRYRFIVLIPALLFLARISDIVTNVELSSGFYKHTNIIYLLAQLAVVIVALAVLSRLFKNLQPPKSNMLRLGGAGFITIAVSGLLIAYASFMKILEIIRIHPLYHFFMNKLQLKQVGYSSSSFKIEFVCAIIGICAALYFIWWAILLLNGKEPNNSNNYFALVPVMWYCINAISVFISAPINAHNSITVVQIASYMIMASFWFSIARYNAFSETPNQLKQIAKNAFLVLAVTVAYYLPNIAIYIQRSQITAANFVLADLASAICGVYIADKIIQSSKEINDV